MKSYIKRKAQICLVLAFIISNINTEFTVYNYRGMQCGIEHLGFSAPASTAILFGIPGYIIVLIFLISAYFLYNNSNK